jgi:hypothetical protein
MAEARMLKEAALDRTVRKILFERGYGSVVDTIMSEYS